MRAFEGDLVVRSLDDDCLLWRLEQPIRHGGITVPAGFETDAASIPKVIRVALPAWGKYARAAILHDWLYANLAWGNTLPGVPTREAADRLFRDAMIASNVPAPLAWAMWAAVRLFGSRRAKLR